LSRLPASRQREPMSALLNFGFVVSSARRNCS
jgi:hypothetical protein